MARQFRGNAGEVTSHEVVIGGRSQGSQSSDDLESIRFHYLDCPPLDTISKSRRDSVGKGTLLLIHGFPQTSYQFRYVMEPLARYGYRVIAPDHTGAGKTSICEELDAYTKAQMATDLEELLRNILGNRYKDTPLHLVGHDVGGMIAYAYAQQYPDEVGTLIWGECPLPGSSFYQACKTTVEQFHFVFHQVATLPEELVEGKELVYLRHFFGKNSAVSGRFLTEADLLQYVRSYSGRARLKAAFNLYRNFEQDAKYNLKWRQKLGRCSTRSLCLSGELSEMHANAAPSMVADMFEDGVCSVDTVAFAGHYIAEEHPVGFVAAIAEFLGDELRDTYSSDEEADEEAEHESGDETSQ